MNTKLFHRLVQKIITDNGAGHKEVEQCLEQGQLTEEEKSIVLFAASIQALKTRLEELEPKIEAV